MKCTMFLFVFQLKRVCNWKNCAGNSIQCLVLIISHHFHHFPSFPSFSIIFASGQNSAFDSETIGNRRKNWKHGFYKSCNVKEDYPFHSLCMCTYKKPLGFENLYISIIFAFQNDGKWWKLLKMMEMMEILNQIYNYYVPNKSSHPAKSWLP